jgi:Concanavalin A-like lectin/glucanases superfamily
MNLLKTCLATAIVLACVQTTSADWTTTITASNPLNWYRLDELAGTTALDHGSQGLDGAYGTGVNAPARGIPAPTGTGISFDGDQDSIHLGGSDLTGDWSAEFIVDRYAAKRSSDLIRGAAFEFPSTALKLEQWDNTGQVGFTQFGAADLTFTPGVVAPIGQFIDLVYVKNNSGMKAYLNGALAGTSNSSISLSRYQIGDDVSPAVVTLGNESPFMLLDEVVIYDRALTAGEIASHSAAVPEPSTAVLSFLGMIAALAHRARQCSRHRPLRKNAGPSSALKVLLRQPTVEDSPWRGVAMSYELFFIYRAPERAIPSWSSPVHASPRLHHRLLD